MNHGVWFDSMSSSVELAEVGVNSSEAHVACGAAGTQVSPSACVGFLMNPSGCYCYFSSCSSSGSFF